MKVQMKRLLIERYQKHDGFFGEGYTYTVMLGTLTIESANLHDLEEFLGLNGYLTQRDFEE